MMNYRAQIVVFKDDLAYKHGGGANYIAAAIKEAYEKRHATWI